MRVLGSGEGLVEEGENVYPGIFEVQVYHSGLVYYSGGLSGKYTVLVVCQIVHCASGLSFVAAICLIRQRTDFASWKQRIQLYCQGKENGVNILKSIAEGPFQMGTFQETLAEGNEGALHLGPEQARVYSDLSPEDKDRVNRIEVKGTMHEVHVQLVMGELRTELGMQIQENGVALDEEQLLFIAGGQDNVVDDDVDEQPVQDLTLSVDNVFQADDYPVYDEANPSYDSDILSGEPDHDNYQDAVCEHHEVHEMHDDVQPNYIVYSHADYTSDSNMILYDQYVKDNAVSVIQSNVSSVPNDAYMMILNDMHEQPAQYVSVTTHNNVADKSLTAELATYKEQVELYKRRAKFELTEREQKTKEQLRIVITDRNIKEENLKKELHSVKMQLSSTINHNKSMVEDVTSLKKDFKQKENKYLEEFLDMKALKEKESHSAQLEDTLEIAKITRKKMNEKMKDPKCVKKKVKIAPQDYSKENYLATFTPHKQLTPEQIFWSKDLIKMKDIFEELEAEVDQNVVNRKHDEIERKNLLIAMII
ncbi:hypothetical protein Tco_1485017 [Tanacetum coccineum]